MDEIQSFAMRVNHERKQFEVQINLPKGQVMASMSPTLAGDFAGQIALQAAQSGLPEMNAAARHFVIQKLEFRRLDGRLVMVQQCDGGLMLYSNVTDQMLLDLQHQIDLLANGASPPPV